MFLDRWPGAVTTPDPGDLINGTSDADWQKLAPTLSHQRTVVILLRLQDFLTAKAYSPAATAIVNYYLLELQSLGRLDANFAATR